jgi:hypothetical protein
MVCRKTLFGAAGAALLSQLEACGTSDANTASGDSLVTAGAPSESGAALSKRAVSNYSPTFLGGLYHIEVTYGRHVLEGSITLYEPSGLAMELNRAARLTDYVYTDTHIIRPIGLGEVNADINSTWRCRLVFNGVIDGKSFSIDTSNSYVSSIAASWKATYISTRKSYRIDFFDTGPGKHLASVRFMFRPGTPAISAAVGKIAVFAHSPVAPVKIEGTTQLTNTHMNAGSASFDRDDRTQGVCYKFRLKVDPWRTATTSISGVDTVVMPKFDHAGNPSGYTSIAPLATYLDGDPKTLAAVQEAAKNQVREFEATATAAQFSLSASTADVHSSVREEILRLCGGKALIDDYRCIRGVFTEKMTSLATLDATDLLGPLVDSCGTQRP